MQKLRFLSLLSVIIFVVGCGGSNSPIGNFSGRATFIIEWSDPTRSEIQAESIEIIVSNESSVVARKVVQRDKDQNQTLVVIERLPSGNLTSAINVYPQARANGIPESRVAFPLAIESGANTSLTFISGGTVEQIELTPQNPSTLIGDTVQLIATPKTLTGEIVLISPDCLTWTSSDESLASVNTDGLVTGLKTGRAAISVFDKISGLNSSVEVRVNGAIWTVLVYMAADNNLEPWAIKDLNEMEIVGSTSEVSVVVQIDRSSRYDSSNGDWDTTRRYFVTQDTDMTTINSELIEDLGELNMADPQTLADFVNWGVSSYPADNYLLVLWNHGRGWYTRNMQLLSLEREVKAIFIDESFGAEMTLDGLRQAFKLMPNMDIVLFDACLMGMIEVAYSLRGQTDIMIASEENVYVNGQPYDRLLGRLTANPSINPWSLSSIIIDEYMDYYAMVNGSTYTLSAIDMSKIDPLISATTDFSKALLANMDAIRPQVRLAQSQAQRYDWEKGTYRHYKDLYDFARLTNNYADVPEVKSTAQNVMSSLKNSVIYQRHSGGKVANSHGLSIYLPDPGTKIYSYSDLEFAKATNWHNVIASY